MKFNKKEINGWKACLLLSVIFSSLLFPFYMLMTFNLNLNNMEQLYKDNGNAHICSMANLTMEEGYCLKDMSKTSTKYELYVDCSWVNLKIIGNYPYPTFEDKAILWVLHCEQNFERKPIN